MLVNNFIKETGGVFLEAKIYKENDSSHYSINYFVNGVLQKTETFPDRSIFYVEDAAENWLNGIKKLNG